MKRDIEKREDVVLLVDSFYEKVLKNEVIGHFFTEVIAISWSEHIPKMYDFWCSVLFSKGGYRGNPVRKHIELHQLKALNSLHFDAWLNLFRETVSEHFSGPKSEEAIEKAQTMVKLIAFKIEQSQQTGFVQ